MLDLLFSKRASLENPSTSLSDPANWLFEALGAVPSSAKVSVTPKSAIQITAVWSAVNTISDTLAELPIRLVHTKRNGRKSIVRSHPAVTLLQTSPNPFMTPIVHKSTCQGHTLLNGNSYTMINFNNAGEPAELWPLDPTLTIPRVNNGRLRFETRLADGVGVLPSEDVIHIPALARNGIAGMSIIAEQREALGHAIAVQDFGSKFFANGAKPGGLVSFDNKIRDPQKVRKAIEEQYSGENVHGLLVLDNGAKYASFAIPPDDAQFLQTKEFTVDDIGRMFRLPAHFLNKMGQATFNNLEQMGAHFVQYTLMPWVTRWEQELTRKLLTADEIARGFAFKFVVAGLMRGDIKTRSEVWAKAIANGWMTRNEVRAMEEMNPIEGLDDPLMPANLRVVGEEPVDNTPPPPDANAEQEEEQEEDDNEGRGLLVMRAMCERMIAKEVNAVRSAFSKTKGANDLHKELRRVYARQEELLRENLAFSEDIARQYRKARVTEAMTHGISDIESMLLRWRTEGVNEMIELMNEDES